MRPRTRAIMFNQNITEANRKPILALLEEAEIARDGEIAFHYQVNDGILITSELARGVEYDEKPGS